MSEEKEKASLREKVLSFLKTFLPIATLSAIIRYLKRRLWYSERKVEEQELENEYLKNENAVEEANKDKSDIDIVRDAIREGSGSKPGSSD